MQHISRWTLCLLLLLCSSGISKATDSDLFFKVFEIDTKGPYREYLIDDLNGDDLKDIVVLKEKVWLLFFQTPAGFVSPEPDQQFEPDSQMLAFDFGDVDREPGKELVYFTNQGLYFCKIKGKRMEENPSRLIRPESIFHVLSGVSKPRFFEWRFVGDFNEDGNDDILVPLTKHYAIYSKDNNGQYRLMTEFEGETHTSIYGGREIINGHYSTEKFLFTDYDRDGRKDIVSVGEEELKIFFQDSSSSFPKRPSKTVSIPFKKKKKLAITVGGSGTEEEQASLSEIVDLNDDGFLDLVAQKMIVKESVFNPRSQIQIYLGREDQEHAGTGCYFDDTPDHIVVSEGVQVSSDALELNGDGKLDLVISTIKLGIFKIVKMLLTRTATVDVWFYTMNANDSYSETPDFKKDLSISFSSNILSAESSPVLNSTNDFNGDGINDLLTSRSEDEIAIFYGGGKRLFGEDEDVKFKVQLPRDGKKVRGNDMNNDDKSDIIITYDKNDGEGKLQNVIRILITRE